MSDQASNDGSPQGEGQYPPEEEIHYDLAGNPLPGRPSSQPAYPPAQGHYAAPPNVTPGYTLPPRQYGGAPPNPAQWSPPVSTGAQPQNRTGWYIAVAAEFVFLIVIIILARGSRPAPIVAPTAFTSIDCPDKSFTCDGPQGQGWQTEQSGVEGSDSGDLTFTDGPVKIDLSSSQSLSFMADALIPPAQNSDTDNPNATTAPPPPPPVEKIHKMQESDVANQFDGYTEMPEQDLQNQFGDGRISEWTATGGMLGGKLHGYRVTIIGKDKAVTAVCQCPEVNWPVMQPVFLKVLQSIVPGTG